MTSSSRSASNFANAGADAKTSPSARSFFWARPLGMTTIIGTALPSAIRLSRMTSGVAEPLPFRLVAADAVQQVEHGVLPVGGVTRRRVDVHLAARADRLRVVLDHLQLAVRDVVADRLEVGRRVVEGGLVVGAEHDGAAEAAAAAAP